MRINQIVETPEGEVEVSANLSEEQTRFLIEVGLNVVLAKGAKPFIQDTDFEPSQILTGTDTIQ